MKKPPRFTQGRISHKCNFRENERARFARCGEHGSNTGAWERAGKTTTGSAQREMSGSERVKVPCYSASVPVALASAVATASLC